MNDTRMLVAGAALAGLAVAAGAFGAHALAETLSAPDLAIYETAVRYQMYHGLGLVAAAALRARFALRGAAHCWLWGTVVFSGSLYALVVSQARWFGAITPVGGTLLILGWLLALLAARRAAPDATGMKVAATEGR